MDNYSDSNFRSIEEIPLAYRSVFGGYPCFNTIQSAVLDDALKTDNCLVVSAPTGSGKTAIFEMAIVRLLMLNENNGGSLNFKIIYISPIKALCMERMIDWHKKFSGFGIRCVSLTSDSENMDIKNVNHYNLLIATPEKWDVITRRWRDNKHIVESISLFMIDEVHLLNDSRGSTLEVIVSRMKTAESIMTLNSENTRIRFIALSATIPNIDDIAEWIEPNGTAKLFKFSENVRPVKLNKVVHGFSLTTSSIFKFELSLNYKLPNLIYKYSEGKPTLIFCSTRKSVEMTTNHLIKNLQIRLAQDQKEILNQISMKIGDVKLKQYVAYGIALHHAGLVLENRNTIEDAFRKGYLPILVTTSTLAMGVNLPAHLVIVKGTKRYDAREGYKDYDEVAIFQMIGRAGRSQFDTSATALILTSIQDKLKYEQMLSCTQNIESNLHKHLTEHLNAEIVLKTITDLEVAMRWLSSTFLYVRARKNPEKYKLPVGLPQEKIDKKLLEICQISLNKLVRAGMIKMNQEIEMAPTVVGEIMAKYYIAFDTMEMFTKINGDEIMIQLLALFSKCHEFSEIYLRSNDKKCLNLLNKNTSKESNRFPLTGRIKSVDMKINCIIQAVLGNLDINDQSVLNDATRVMRNCERLAKCLIEYLETRTKCYTALLNTIILAKCFYVKLWENSPYVSKQLTGVGRVISSLLAKAGKTTFKEIINTNPRHIEMIVGRKAPFGNTLVEQALHIPEYQMTLERSNSTVILKIDLLNPDATRETPTVKLDSTMTLLVGDSENNILLYEKYSHFYMLDNRKVSRIINIENDKLNFVAASLISDDWVGIDCQAKLECSDTPSTNETRIFQNKNNKQTYMDMYMQKVRGPIAPKKKHQQRSGSKEVIAQKENPTEALVRENSAENENKIVTHPNKIVNELNSNLSVARDQHLNPVTETPNITKDYLDLKNKDPKVTKENYDKVSSMKKPTISKKKKIIVSKSIFRTASKSEHIRKMEKRSKSKLLNDKDNKNQTREDSVLEVVDSPKNCLSPILRNTGEKQLKENKAISYNDQNDSSENEQNYADFEKNYDKRPFYESSVDKEKRKLEENNSMSIRQRYKEAEKENTNLISNLDKNRIQRHKDILKRHLSEELRLNSFRKPSEGKNQNPNRVHDTSSTRNKEILKRHLSGELGLNSFGQTSERKNQNSNRIHENSFTKNKEILKKHLSEELGVNSFGETSESKNQNPNRIHDASLTRNKEILKRHPLEELRVNSFGETSEGKNQNANCIHESPFTKNKEILKKHLSEELRLNSFVAPSERKNQNLNVKIDTPKSINKSYLVISKNKSYSQDENVDFDQIVNDGDQLNSKDVDNSPEENVSEEFLPLSTQVNNIIDDFMENQKCIEENTLNQEKTRKGNRYDNKNYGNKHSPNFKFLVPQKCCIGVKKSSQKPNSLYSNINLCEKLSKFDEIEDISNDEPEEQKNHSSKNITSYNNVSEEFLPLSTQVNNIIDDLMENQNCIEENTFNQEKTREVNTYDHKNYGIEHSPNFKFLVPQKSCTGVKKSSQKPNSSYSNINLSEKLSKFDEIEDISNDEPEKQKNDSSKNTTSNKECYNEDFIDCKLVAALYKKYNLKPMNVKQNRDQIETEKSSNLLCGKKGEADNSPKEIKTSMQPFKRQDFLTPNAKKQKREESFSSSFEVFQPKSIKWRSPLVHSPPEKFTPNTTGFCFDFINESSDGKEDTGEGNDLRLETQDTSSSSTNLNVSTNSQKHSRPASSSSSTTRKKIKFPLTDQEYLNETLNKKIQNLNDLCDIEYFGLKENNENPQKDTTSASQYYSQVMGSQRKNNKNEAENERAKTSLKDNMVEAFQSGINSPLKTLPQSPNYHSSNPAMMCSQVCDHPEPPYAIPPNPNIPYHQHPPNMYHPYNTYSNFVDESNMIHRHHLNSSEYLNQSFIKSENPVEELSQRHAGNCCGGHVLQPRSCFNPEYHFCNELRHPEMMSPYSVQHRCVSIAGVRRPMARYADPNPYFREIHSSPILDPRYPVHHIEKLHPRTTQTCPSYVKPIPDPYLNPYHSQLIDQQHGQMGQREVHSASPGNHFKQPIQYCDDNSSSSLNNFYLDNKHFHNSQMSQKHDTQLGFHSANPNRSLQQSEQFKLKEASRFQGIKGLLRDSMKSPKKQLIHDQHFTSKQPQKPLFVTPSSSQRKKGGFNSFEERLENAVSPRTNGYALSSNRDHYYDARASEFSARQYQPNDGQYNRNRFHF